ncbi:argonaute inhibitor protein 1 [Schizosaccharomyces pombe]|uniref:Argonaute-binding protein 1 n=1 Tax=Schizosaccharomyces pombe (strain 972 / ATCC 24843) TaxID=284812 RepID=ARB1_SCHPO|nr:argonaute-binding protein 1 [Schizosaccharomyces pombe]Q9P7B8.1 RecName: Full=Argonaute-binding protein 1 [Schizosaccharomyces pombe 972h-]CAB86414.1 argonaute binding protein 1 [Schizosaccharomyces pombe]|eukprot:NP_593532.1 argonaute-binding protein 1 [Schizosaccharomyces pombe]
MAEGDFKNDSTGCIGDSVEFTTFKKRTGKSLGNRRKKRGLSGWEPYFQEPELTAEEKLENETLYSRNIPLTVRMERFIQRYRSRRKWSDPTRIRLFTMYLDLGGVSTGQKQFTGGTDINNDAKAREVSAQTTTDYIEYDILDEYDIDFKWVAGVFLSSHILYNAGLTKEEDLQIACQIVRNFLLSVLHNNVAPEFEDNIRDACLLAEQAETELISNKRLSTKLPGRLQRALASIHVDNYKGLWDKSQSDRTSDSSVNFIESNNTKFMPNDELFEPDGISRFSTQQARDYIQRTLGPRYLTGKVVEQEYLTVKLVSKTLLNFSNQSLCKAVFIVWDPPGSKYSQDTNKERLEVILESDLLNNTVDGTHLEGSFTFLDNGLTILDTVLAVLPTFYEEVKDE